ncbi:DUF1003 domain-containing protein [Luteolibacter sp. GHJ8]|uniref:DUF1003 domain-containing protein n=1 Tax=Luteolibacter rhizosphaerae TaxID=2989719 RepID=A0ABT3FYZ0_9BACT|nr:DUF1003 domain-containing protein [Luteolibacter rhizosphaerae]MCW1912791.1 DUF1003 domain-containing protein [Luteolibacter rhizosphaerae]
MKKCAITGQETPDHLAVPLSAIRPLLRTFILKRHPDLPAEGWVSRSALDELRSAYIEDALQNEIGELTELEREVIDSIRGRELIAERPETEEEEDRTATFGERLSDRIASFGGSWRFILLFSGFLAVWIILNALQLFGGKAVDPYPFILLNLLLSCIAALQAPIIMMSQNRQQDHDRKEAMRDYQVNLKAELEIRHLHEKMDHLLLNHSERLMEIQQYQTELLQRILGEKESKD